MPNIDKKVAEKVGIVVQGGRVNISELRIEGEHESTRSKAEKLLIQQVSTEVESRLSQSLHNQILINLGKYFKPQLVSRFWDKENKIGKTAGEQLPESTTILDVFERPDVSGKLLILGAPGSGKTTMLIELAKELVHKAKSDLEGPIPVILSITSWENDRYLVLDWLLNELRSKYGTPYKIARHFIEQNKLAFLLDGLDELPYSRQDLFMKRLNLFMKEDFAPQYLVVSCRKKEYESNKNRLRLNGAVVFQALKKQQLEEYFLKLDKSNLLRSIDNNESFIDLLQTPLFLNIYIATYKRLSDKKLKSLKTIDDYKNYLLDNFIDEAFSKMAVEFQDSAIALNRIKYRQWLSWMAKLLENKAQSEFILDEIQPSTLGSSKLIKFHDLLTNVSIGLISFISCVIASWSTNFEIGNLLWISLCFSFFGYFVSTLGILNTATLSRILKSQIFTYSSIYLFSYIAKRVFGIASDFSAYSNTIFFLILAFFALAISAVGGLNSDGSIEMIKTSRLRLDCNFREFHLACLGGFVASFYNFFVLPFNKFFMAVDSMGIIIISFMACAALFLLVYGIIGRFFNAVETLGISHGEGLACSAKSSITALLFFGLLFGLVFIGLFGPTLISLLYCPVITADEIKSFDLRNFSLAFDLHDFSLDYSCNKEKLKLFVRLLLHTPTLSLATAGICFGLTFGGVATIQHSLLRAILYLNGRTPFNYLGFLEICHDNLLLQRTGGRYRFIHKLLQEHFANTILPRSTVIKRTLTD